MTTSSLELMELNSYSYEMWPIRYITIRPPAIASVRWLSGCTADANQHSSRMPILVPN